MRANSLATNKGTASTRSSVLEAPIVLAEPTTTDSTMQEAVDPGIPESKLYSVVVGDVKIALEDSMMAGAMQLLLKRKEEKKKVAEAELLESERRRLEKEASDAELLVAREALWPTLITSRP